MEARNSWGIVYVAAASAVVIIGGALLIHWHQARVTAAAAPAADNTQGVIASVPPAASRDVAGAVSQDIYTSYLNLVQQGTPTQDQQKQLIANALQKEVQPQSVVPVLSVSQLNLVETTSVPDYISLVAVILNQSTKIKQEESYVFGDTVQNGITTGTPTLMTDANLYYRIANALFVMPVPPAVAAEHLEVVKSVTALGNSVKNMGQWKGDPIEALAEVDTYNKAKAYVESSTDALTAAVEQIEAKQKS